MALIEIHHLQEIRKEMKALFVHVWPGSHISCVRVISSPKMWVGRSAYKIIGKIRSEHTQEKMLKSQACKMAIFGVGFSSALGFFTYYRSKACNLKFRGCIWPFYSPVKFSAKKNPTPKMAILQAWDFSGCKMAIFGVGFFFWKIRDIKSHPENGHFTGLGFLGV